MKGGGGVSIPCPNHHDPMIVAGTSPLIYIDIGKAP